MNGRQLADYGDRAALDVTRLSELERNELARMAVTLGYVRRATVRDGYYAEALRILDDLAPSLGGQLRRMLDEVDTYHERTEHP